jgi:hypothetical protein
MALRTVEIKLNNECSVNQLYSKTPAEADVPRVMSHKPQRIGSCRSRTLVGLIGLQERRQTPPPRH